MTPSQPLNFKLEKKIKQARVASFELWSHGCEKKFTIKTPTFMPVGTCASVKALSSQDIKATGAQIILGNTYHLFLRPGHELIEKLGGLQKFMAWDGPMLTDSGGYQVFSLSKLNKITDEGVIFKSHLDGQEIIFTPEKVMEIQRALGSQIVMAFDDCPPYPADDERIQKALTRTHRWAERGLQVSLQKHQVRFAIVQGGMSEIFRKQSVDALTALPFDGYAIGGLSIGEPVEMLHKMTHWTAPFLPEEKPRYLMGVGRPEDLIEGVKAGIDLFDCVMPSRNARNGQAFTSLGKINIKNSQYKEDLSRLDPNCHCETCQTYTKAYLRHLYSTHELLSHRLLTLHNLTFYLSLMEQMRNALIENQFDEWEKSFYTQFHVHR